MIHVWNNRILFITLLQKQLNDCKHCVLIKFYMHKEFNKYFEYNIIF